MSNKLRQWFAIHPKWMLALITIATLSPFLAKPFNIDDPLFVWAAQQIQAHPGNPYGFDVNWYGRVLPMWLVTENPPLTCYYLALAAGIFGWSEIGFHFACLLPAIMVVLGTYRLAKSFCRWPQFAALATLFMPGLLVSATTVMCDVSMLAFWIWTVVFWTEGIKQDNGWKLATAGTLLALALLTKYFGICLIPLLAVYGWLEKRTVGCWASYLLIPLATLCAYEWLTRQLYGQASFVAATHYANFMQTSSGISSVVKAVNALTFTGGCFAIALFCAPFLWCKRVLAMLAGGAAFFVALALADGMMAENYTWFNEGVRSRVEIQIIFWSIGGVCVLALALADVRHKQDASSWLLLLWVLGTFTFTAFVNWTVNVRALLPMTPAVAILIARRLEQNRPSLSGGIKLALVASAAFSLLAAQADFQLAGAVRQNAKQVCAKFAANPGAVWFQGHWGFQYYMQSFGAVAIDINHPLMQSGGVLIIPSQNVNQRPPDPKKATLLEIFSTPVIPWFATFSPDVGASFYASFFGPLPFAFGDVLPDTVFVFVLKPPAETSP